MIRKLFMTVALILVVGIVGGLTFAPGYLENTINVVTEHEPYVISDEAQALHDSLIIGDLHSDTLLWKRNVLTRATRGHVDLPRLQDGNVAIQQFTAVTKVPAGLNYEENSADTDQLRMAMPLQLWPIRTWNSPHERARYQALRLRNAVDASNGEMRLVRTQGDLVQILAARANDENVTAAVLGTEGSHALDGEHANIQVLFDDGYRTMGLHHFFDNRLGGSLHGLTGEGLSEFGREAVRQMLAMGIILDVAHSSEAVVDDVLAMTDRPVMVSHTGVYGNCASPRNISDDHMQRIAAEGGLIGIGYWEGALCDTSPEGVVMAIRYAIDLVGIEHVGLGSDYDGSTNVMFDTSELAVLTQTMMDQGFSDDEIRAVMGGNVARFYLDNLPE